MATAKTLRGSTGSDRERQFTGEDADESEHGKVLSSVHWDDQIDMESVYT